MMPEKKGTVAKVRVKPDVLIKGAKQDMYFVTLEDSQVEYSGIGTCPWKKGETAEFMYIVNEEAEGKVYLNITSILNAPAEPLKKASELTPDAKIDQLIQAIAGAKISVSIDKTISERQYEPKKYSVFISVPVGIRNPVEMAQKIHELFDMAEVELANRVNGKPKPNTLNPWPEKPATSETGKPTGSQESSDSSPPGQKSLVRTPPPPEPKEKKCDSCGGRMKKTRIKSGPGLGTEEIWQCEDCDEREPV
jgi:hypothetical protein